MPKPRPTEELWGLELWVSTIADIIQITTRLPPIIYQHVNRPKPPTRDLKALITELTSFYGVLYALQDYLEAHHQTNTWIWYIGEPLDSYKQELEKLEPKLKHRGMMKTFKPPLKGWEIARYRAMVEAHKSIFMAVVEKDITAVWKAKAECDQGINTNFRDKIKARKPTAAQDTPLSGRLIKGHARAAARKAAMSAET